jgi:hypothetical protein
MFKNCNTKTLLLFFVSAYIFSWMIWLPLLVMGRPANLVVLLLGISVPSLQGIIFTYRSQPPAARTELWSRLSPVRITSGWALVSILILPMLYMVATAEHSDRHDIAFHV